MARCFKCGEDKPLNSYTLIKTIMGHNNQVASPSSKIGVAVCGGCEKELIRDKAVMLNA